MKINQSHLFLNTMYSIYWTWVVGTIDWWPVNTLQESDCMQSIDPNKCTFSLEHWFLIKKEKPEDRVDLCIGNFDTTDP